MTNRVIDADGHMRAASRMGTTLSSSAAAPERLCREVAIAPIRSGSRRSTRPWISINGALRRNLRPAAACVPWGMDDPNNVPTWEDILPGSYDGGARAKVLEEEGIERSLLFPSLYLLAGDIEDPAVAAATCHGYNEWIADMCRDGRGKLSAVGIVPLQSAEAAAREAEHIARLGLKGVCFRPERYKGLALYDEVAEAVLAGRRRQRPVRRRAWQLRRADAELRHRPLRQSLLQPHDLPSLRADGGLPRHRGRRRARAASRPARRLPRIGPGLAGILARPAGRPFRLDAPSRAVAETPADRAVPRAVLHLDRIGRGAPPAAAQRNGPRRLRVLGRRLSPLRLHLSRRGEGARGEPGAARHPRWPTACAGGRRSGSWD